MNSIYVVSVKGWCSHSLFKWTKAFTYYFLSTYLRLNSIKVQSGPSMRNQAKIHSTDSPTEITGVSLLGIDTWTQIILCVSTHPREYPEKQYGGLQEKKCICPYACHFRKRNMYTFTENKKPRHLLNSNQRDVLV